MCTIDFLDKVIAAGVRVLKIEGRARGAEYVKRTVECYDAALRAIERGDYNSDYAAQLKERLATVFNRGFWEGYFAGRPTVEHSQNYGSAATKQKVYVGKVTNFYKKISVAEITVEASTLDAGDTIFFTGATTGMVEQTAAEIYLNEHPVAGVKQGDVCSIKAVAGIHRGDRLYKEIDRIDRQ